VGGGRNEDSFSRDRPAPYRSRFALDALAIDGERPDRRRDHKRAVYRARRPLQPHRAIQKGTYTTSNGLFDDCYSLAAQKPLPPDFVLKAEQNHLLNGAVISKNEVTFYPDRIHFCSHHRLTQSCDFSARCSL
jgi:hypothetical protein